MSDSVPGDVGIDPSPASRSTRRMALIIGVMVVLCVGVIWQRTAIRVWWWGRQLAHSETLSVRLHYLNLLASVGDPALPGARRLLADRNAGVRSFGVALTNVLKRDEALDLLFQASTDTDREVRRAALLGLANRRCARAAALVGDLARQADESVAMLATSLLPTVDAAAALEQLQRLAKEDARPAVRAQAIETIALLDDERVIGVLIDCLADDAVYEGLTEVQREALAAAQIAVGATQPVVEDEAGPIGRQPVPNGSRAARALKMLTGESFGYLDGDASQRDAAMESWRRWQAHEHD